MMVPAVIMQNYVGHPGQVARTEDRRLLRQYAGSTVQVTGERITAWRVHLDATIQQPARPPFQAPPVIALTGVAVVTGDGTHFHVVWSV